MFQVSIMQIASEKKAFIFDLIKLHREVPESLDNCLTRILLSPGILKLGMIFFISLVSWVYQQKILLVNEPQPNFWRMTKFTWIRMLLLKGIDNMYRLFFITTDPANTMKHLVLFCNILSLN
jgi:hypothetical protein